MQGVSEGEREREKDKDMDKERERERGREKGDAQGSEGSGEKERAGAGREGVSEAAKKKRDGLQRLAARLALRAGDGPLFAQCLGELLLLVGLLDAAVAAGGGLGEKGRKGVTDGMA